MLFIGKKQNGILFSNKGKSGIIYMTAWKKLRKKVNEHIINGQCVVNIESVLAMSEF